MQRREAFKRWLQNERINKSGKLIPEERIDGYLKSVHRISNVMYETGVISTRLYSMRGIKEVQAAVSSIKHDRTYLTMNTKSENMYHKALEYYIAFTKAEAVTKAK